MTKSWKVRLVLGATIRVRIKVRIMNSPLSINVESESEIGKTSYGENLGRRM